MAPRTSLRIRRATVADLPPFLELMTVFNAHEQIPWQRARGAPALRRLITTPALGVVLVATLGEQLVGYAILTWGFDLEWNGRDAMLTELMVDAAARGRGVGGKLIAAIEREARAGGAAAMHLMVRHRNKPARALYERTGFRAPGRLLLTKPLGPRPRR